MRDSGEVWHPREDSLAVSEKKKEALHLDNPNQGGSPDTGVKSRKRGRRKKKKEKSRSIIYSRDRPKIHETIAQNNILKLAHKFNQLEVHKNKLDQFMSWYGDEMVYDDEWPHRSQRPYFRIFGINMNGISYHNKYVEWELIQQLLHDMQIDLYSITEPNLDLNSGTVRETLRKTVRQQDPHAMMVTSASKQQLDVTPFKMGGTIMHCHGGWTGRIKRSGSDPLGRWTFMALEAARNKEVVIITLYRVCAQHTSVGEGTIYMQQKKDLLDATGKDVDPRQDILDSLTTSIQHEHAKGNLVILIGDANEDLSKEESTFNQFLSQVGLCNAFLARVGQDADLPVTYDRGSTCIDVMAITAGLPPELIHRAGYLPFYYNPKWGPFA